MRISSSAAALVVALAIASCHPGPPKPPLGPQPPGSYAEVPYPPPPARVEMVPPSPRPGAVWVDGQWQWRAARWVWEWGGWVIPPEGAKYARWETYRKPDGTLYYAPGTWVRDNEPIPPPTVLAPPRDEPASDTGPAVPCPPGSASASPQGEDQRDEVQGPGHNP